MSWLKGPNVGGKITIDDNINFTGSVLASNLNQTWGTIYYVDATNGNDDYDGLTPARAMKTVQVAITAQLADTTSLGDVIYVMPGTYSEAVIATTFTKTQLIGATCGGNPKAVVIHNSAGHALCIGEDTTYTTTMANSGIRNIAFYTPGTSNTEYAALRIDTMQMSVIDNCYFLGNYQAGAGSITTVGLQIGCLTGTKYSFHEFGTISNCRFGTSGARAKEVDTAIRVGADSVTTPASSGFSSMSIVNNMITAEHYGIRLGVGAASCGGSIIKGNTLHSNQGGGGINVGIISNSTNGSDDLMMIHDNRINAHTSTITNFETENMMGNIVSLDNATGVGLYPVST